LTVDKIASIRAEILCCVDILSRIRRLNLAYKKASTYVFYNIYIYIFNKITKRKARTIKNKIRYHLKRSEVSAIRELIKNEGGIDFARSEINRISNEAEEALNIFSASIYKENLISLLSFNVERMQ